MSKKDYQAIARAIYGHKPEPLFPESEVFDRAEYDVWEGVMGAIADILAADSPRFDRARFVEACETGATKGMPKR
jgi:hypothetical protein